MAKQTIRLNELDFKKIVSEAVKNFLKEDTKAQRMKDPMNQWFKDMDRAQRLRDTMDYVTNEPMFVKCVECYDENDDIVFVAALTDGSDSVAVRNVKKRYPNLEVSSVNDVDGKLKKGDMGSGAYRLFKDGAVMVDDCIQSVDDLEWVNESKKSKKRMLKETAGDSFTPVNKWVFWCFNWEPIENYAHIFKGAPKEHFIDKFNGCRGDMNRFYAELDTTNRAILVDYVMNNYKG